MALTAIVFKCLFLLTVFCGKGSCMIGGIEPGPRGEFSEGDLVQVSSDKEFVMNLPIGDIAGFNDAIVRGLGKIGRVMKVNSDDTLSVELCDTIWEYNFKAVTKLASPGDSTPEVSSGCTSSNATVEVEQRRNGNDLDLTCIVVNWPSPTYEIRWVKNGTQVSQRVLTLPYPGITHASPSLSLQISTMKPEDAGWYTCEVKDYGELAAVAAVELKAKDKESSEKTDSTTETIKEGTLQAEDVVQVLSDEEIENKLPQIHGGKAEEALEEVEETTKTVTCPTLLSMKKRLQDLKALIANSKSEFLSRIGDISDRMNMVELRSHTSPEDEPAVA